jgi:hypothetical protein
VLRLQRGWQMTSRVWLVALAACAAQSRPASQPAASSQTNPHDEIESLSKEIDGQRTELGMSTAMPMSTMANPVAAAASCPRPDNDRCSQTCTLSDSICGNAKRICELADRLAGDTWASGKCDDAKQVCAAATQHCCECS